MHVDLAFWEGQNQLSLTQCFRTAHLWNLSTDFLARTEVLPEFTKGRYAQVEGSVQPFPKSTCCLTQPKIVST